MFMARPTGDLDGSTAFDSDETRLLTVDEERDLLRELGRCKQKLAEALAETPGARLPEGGEAPQALAQFISQTYNHQDGQAGARLGAVYHRYTELRVKLAMANMRLVAHIAKRFRDRGIAFSDLLQEGFCGLLEAIDRFDLSRETKLATYATWWIRQSMQQAVAGGAYPVRLSPRHLRQLARNQEELAPSARPAGGTAGPAEMIRRIHSATRPTVSLNASLDTDTNFRLLLTMSDPEGDRTDDIDTDETVARLMGALRPREQQVLALRFGLGGKQRLSLSQVGKAMAISKERVRQIQDRALEKLRKAAGQEGLADALLIGD